MKVIKTIGQLRRYRGGLTGSVGLVPTLGFLHQGHLSLVNKSVTDNDYTIVSVFVNPTQFGPDEDFESYPRDTGRDLALLEAAQADAVFLPDAAEVYPPSADTTVVPGQIAERLEGASRPGHFRGVATVVLKLLNLAQPHNAYFGQKDAQQLAVIRKIAADLNVPVRIVAMPTVREADGLAMSSRNSYLSPTERQAATVLYRSLKMAEEFISRGQTDADIIKNRMAAMIEAEPLAEIDYISIAEAGSLRETVDIKQPFLVSLAVKIGRTRLIDNFISE